MSRNALSEFVESTATGFGIPGVAVEYILTSGEFKRIRGFLTRDENGVVVGVDLAGRLFSRVAPAYAGRR